MNLLRNLKQQLGGMVENFTLMRAELFRRLLGTDGKDIDKECGYPADVEIDTPTLFRMFEREGVARKVVKLYPEECFQVDPIIYESEDQESTAFETVWNDICDRHNFWYWLERVDEDSGIGRYGVLIIGIDDGLDLSQPIPWINDRGEATPGKAGEVHQIIYLRSMTEKDIMIESTEQRSDNPRFGQPVFYNLTADVTKKIHWTRVIHVADNRQASEVLGTPRMQCVYNRLYDLRKIYGGAAEMFYKGGFQGLSIEVAPGLLGADQPGVVMDKEEIKKEMEEYYLGLKRYLALEGLTAKSLAPSISDPTHHVDVCLQAIAIAMSCPLRVLMGSEEAKLASSQDMKTWNKRLKRRCEKYLTPMLIRPFVQRLIMLRVLPFVEQFFVWWPDLNAPSELDKAEIAAKIVEALAKYVGGNCQIMCPPLEFWTIVMGFDLDVAEAIVEAAEQWNIEHPPEEQLPADEGDDSQTQGE